VDPNGRSTSTLAPGQSGRELDLRIDVSATGPFNVVSADLFEVRAIPGQPSARHFIGSWIGENPVSASQPGGIVISGPVRFCGSDATGTVSIAVTAGQAAVTLTRDGEAALSFACRRISDKLRSLDITFDVSARAGDLVMPSHDTGRLPCSPGFASRTIDIAAAFADAGFEVTHEQMPTPVDDTARKFTAWSDAELRDVLASRFLKKRPRIGWPQWSLWALLASKHEQDGIQGVMFDDVDLQQRQGLAVFRANDAFSLLDMAAAPDDQPAASAMRQYLFAWVHELGHALNLEHAGEHGHSNIPSWMNNPALFGSSNDFWSKFEFNFEHDDLMHLRHGALNDVVPGGAPFIGKAGQLSSGFPQLTDAVSSCPLELMLRGRETYRWLAPVRIEVRLRNLSKETLSIDARLHPEAGRLSVFLQRPDGSVQRYVPLTCKMAAPDPHELMPEGSDEGLERYSTSIDLTYGSRGFSFREPGDYVIRAHYQPAPGGPIASNDLRIRIEAPFAGQERRAKAFFAREVGTCLYFQGSRSPLLGNALQILKEITEHHGDDVAAADVASATVQGLGRPFYGLKDGESTLTLHAPEEPELAIASTDRAVDLYRRAKDHVSSLRYNRLVERRADFRKRLGQSHVAAAAKELAQLHNDLRNVVNRPVLDAIRRRIDSLR
jgi:hypothetical protein